MTSQSHTHPKSASLVTFVLAEQTYALPIAPIVQIVEMVAITALPQADSAIQGVINYHGASVPVVDLRRHLGLPAGYLGPDTHLIMLTIAGRTVALAVDRVLQVLDLPARQISQTRDMVPGGFANTPRLYGIAHTEVGTVLVLDPERLFLSDATPNLSAARPDVPADQEADGSRWQETIARWRHGDPVPCQG